MVNEEAPLIPLTEPLIVFKSVEAFPVKEKGE
jgi:hypothetical protein